MNNALALALAEIEGLSGLNFFKEVFAEKKIWAEHKSKFIKTGLLGVLVVGLVLFNFALEIRSQQQHLDRLNAEITATFKSALPEVKKIVDPLHQMRLRVEGARSEAEVSGISENQNDVISILNNISRQIPKTMDVNLVRIDVGPENVLLSGDADTFNTVDDVKIHLEKVETFKRIAISSTSKDKSGKRVQFKMKVQL